MKEAAVQAQTVGLVVEQDVDAQTVAGSSYELSSQCSTPPRRHINFLETRDELMPVRLDSLDFY